MSGLSRLYALRLGYYSNNQNGRSVVSFTDPFTRVNLR